MQKSIAPLCLTILLLAVTGSPLNAQISVNLGGASISVATIARNAVQEPVIQVNIENPIGQPEAQLTSITFTALGTIDDLNDIVPGSVQLWRDANGNGRLDTVGPTPDVQLGSGSFGADNGTITFSGLSVTIPAGAGAQGQLDLILLYSLAPGAVNGETVRCRVAANGDVQARNAMTMAPLTVTGAPITGYLRTVGGAILTIDRLIQSPDGGVAIPNHPILPVLNFTVTNDDVEAVNLNGLNVTEAGTAHGVTGIKLNTVRAFVSANQPSDEVTGLAGLGTFTLNNQTMQIALVPPVVVPRAGSVEMWITLNPEALPPGVLGSTYQVGLPLANQVAAAGVFSGAAPQLIGIQLNGPVWEYNYNPVRFDTGNDPGTVLMPAAAQDYVAGGITLRNDNVVKAEACMVSRLTLHPGGTMNALTAVDGVELYVDNNPTKSLGPEDVLLAGPLPFVNGPGGPQVTMDFSGSPLPLPTSGFIRFIVVYDLNGTATDGETAWVTLQSRDDFEIIGDISLHNSSFLDPPFSTLVKTVGNPRAQLTTSTNAKNFPTIIAPEGPLRALLPMRIKALTDEDLLFDGLTVNVTGPLDEAAYFDELQFYSDDNLNGTVDGADAPVGPPLTLTPAAGNDYTLTLDLPDGSEILIEKNKDIELVLYATVSASVLGDGSEMFTLTVADGASFDLYGLSSLAPAVFDTLLPPLTRDLVIRNPRITVENYGGPSMWLGCINGFYGMSGLQFDVPDGEDIKITEIDFRLTESGGVDLQTRVVGKEAWRDNNRDFLLQSGEVTHSFGIHGDFGPPPLLDSGTGIGTIVMNVSTGVLERNINHSISTAVAFEELDPATAISLQGQFVTMFQEGNMVIRGVGVRSGRPIEVTNMPGDDEGRTITFDRGSVDISRNDIDRMFAVPNEDGIEVLAFEFQTSIIEGVDFPEFTITPLGTVDESVHIKPLDMMSGSGGISFWWDRNGNGTIDTNDIKYGAIDRPASDNAPVTFVLTYPPYFSAYSFSNPTFDEFIIAVDLADTAPEGQTIQFGLMSAADVTAMGDCSLETYALGDELNFVDTPPILGPELTIERTRLNIVTDTGFVSQNLPEVVMAPSAADYEVLRLDIKTQNDTEEVMLTGLTIHTTGSALDDSDLLADTGVKLYRNSFSPVNLLAEGVFDADNGSITFDMLDLTIGKNPSDLRLLFSGSGSGLIGDDFNLSLTAADITAIGLTSNLPVSEILPADPYLALPIRFGTGAVTLRLTGNPVNVLPIPVSGDTQVQTVQFSATRTEDILVEDLRFYATGTADETTALDGGVVFLSQGNPPSVTRYGTAQVLDSGGSPADNGFADLLDLDLLLAAGSSTGSQYHLDVLLDPNFAQSETTLKFDLSTSPTLDIRAIGTLTGLEVPVKLEQATGGPVLVDVDYANGRTVTLTNGILTLSQGPRNPSSMTITGNEQNLPMFQIQLRVENNLESVNITRFRVCAPGTSGIEPRDITQLRLYNDTNNDGLAGGTDVLLATGVFDADDGTAEFILDITYTINSTNRWLVTADLSGQLGINGGGTLQIGLCGDMTIEGNGLLTDGDINLQITAVPLGGLMTVPVLPTPTASPVMPPSPSPAPSPSPSPTNGGCCPGDANNSGSFVDANDFIAVQANFGADNGVGGPGDANCSGSFVDANDFIAVQANFGADCG